MWNSLSYGNLSRPHKPPSTFFNNHNKIDLADNLQELIFSFTFLQHDFNNFDNLTWLILKKVALHQCWTTMNKEFFH